MLRIPTITDRVLMRAVLNILHPVVDRTFLDCSFGYRPRRGLKDSITRIIILRSNEYLWVLDADIDDFFNQVDQELLMVFLAEDLPDKSLLQLFNSWLELCRPNPQIPRGIPMGSPISPLLANIYLHRLDYKIIQDGYEAVRYADDFLVFARSEQRIQQAYVNVKAHLAELRLTFEPSKTRLTSFEKGFHFIGAWFVNDEYRYTYRDKRIAVEGDRVDWLFSQYDPHY